MTGKEALCKYFYKYSFYKCSFKSRNKFVSEVSNDKEYFRNRCKKHLYFLQCREGANNQMSYVVIEMANIV